MNWIQALSSMAFSPRGRFWPAIEALIVASAACGSSLNASVPDMVIGWPSMASAPAGILVLSASIVTLTLNSPVPLVISPEDASAWFRMSWAVAGAG